MTLPNTLIMDPKVRGRVAAYDQNALFRMPYFQVVDRPNEAIVVPANGQSTIYISSVSAEGPSVIKSFSAQKSGAALVNLQIQDGQSGRSLQKSGVHIDTIMGSGQQPFILPEELYIPEGRAVRMTFKDLTGSPNTIRPVFLAKRALKPQADGALALAKQRMERREYISMPYFFGLDGTSIVLTSGSSGQDTISIGNDAHFECMGINVSSTGAFTFDIIDVATGESIIDGFNSSNFQQANANIAGTANFPFRFMVPRFFYKNQKLIVTVTDLSGSGNTIYLTLIGRLVADRMWRA